MIRTGNLIIGQNISSETQYGLRVDVTITQTAKDKPLIYTYTYMMDSVKFKRWLAENAYLCEGPLAFLGKGIQIMIVGGAKKWDKSAFSIDGGEAGYPPLFNNAKIFLPLLQQEVQFSVHRDLFSGEEWDVMLDVTRFQELDDAVRASMVGEE